MTQEERTAPPPVRGSWEDLLAQANQLASNQSDEAIPIYEKLLSRLGALPQATRQANNGRLTDIYRAALISYHTFLTVRDRTDEALALLPQIKALESDEERQDSWEYHAAAVLYQTGRPEAALQRLQARLAEPNAPAIRWGQLAMMYVRLHQPEEADRILNELAQILRQRQAEGQFFTAPLNEEQALLASLRANVAFERGDWTAATTAYEEAAALDPYYKENPHILYIRLARHQQYETALHYIQHDYTHPIRAGFWHGYVLYHLDRETEARRQWQKVIDMDINATKERALMEFVLAHYYLGDPEAVALGGVLRILQEERGPSWELLYMAALGWAVRGNVQDARANLALAVAQRKALADGAKLPHESWLHWQDLLDAEAQAQLNEYFEPAA